MDKLFEAFKIPSKRDWLDKINIDLKGKEFDSTLINNYEIEDISFWSQHHKSDSEITQQVPGKSPYTRGSQYENNDWEIVTEIPCGTAEEMNKFALNFLMKGSTALRFRLTNFSDEQCNTLVKEIGFKFITTSFFAETEDQIKWVNTLIAKNPNAKINVFSELHTIQTSFALNRCKHIDASKVLQAGGNSIQELAYALNAGHDNLFLMLEEGLSIDEASAKIKFTFGIGSLYFVEIAKFRAFRTLWNNIIAQYNPKHECSKTAFIEAETIALNKSVKDPYTNLLRQTTEALCAAVGGVNEIAILPYDLRAQKQNPEFTQRMANNISLLLKEESYINKVIDPAGGAYALEKITFELKEKVWSLFQELEKNGEAALTQKILKTRNQRIEAVENGSKLLIGINKYPNIEEVDNEWLDPFETPFGKELILERDCDLELN